MAAQVVIELHEQLSNPLARHASPDSSHKCGRILITVCLSWNGKALLTKWFLPQLCHIPVLDCNRYIPRLLCPFLGSLILNQAQAAIVERNRRGLPSKYFY